MPSPLLAKLCAASELSEEDRAVITAVTQNVRSFPARQDIVRQGDCPDHVRLIVQGWACRYQIVRAGIRQITAFLLPGDFCNLHVTILSRMDHSIATLTPARVASFSQDEMRQLLDRPAIAHALARAGLVDEAVLRAWIVNIGNRDSFERLAHLICELHARLSVVGLTSDDEFELPLTQDTLADALGLTPVHVNRMFGRLHDQGLVSNKRPRLTVLDMPALRNAAGFDPTYLHQDQPARLTAGMSRPVSRLPA